MDMYSIKSGALLQKIWLVSAQICLIALAWYILFDAGAEWFVNWPGFPLAQEIPARRIVLLIFCLVTLARFLVTFSVFMKRSIPREELISVPIAFFTYYVVFAVLALPNQGPFGALDYAGIALFAAGSALNTGSELQRHLFKLKPENKDRLYTGGLFAHSMHINFFGDCLWVAGFACVAGHVWGFAIPFMLVLLFRFLLIPPLDAHLRTRYGADFEAYEARTKGLVPFLW